MQKQVQMIQKQSTTAGKSKEALAKEREKELKLQEKAAEEKRKKENAELFKPVQTQKVPFGVGGWAWRTMSCILTRRIDPKTVLCAFYKAGNCEKGAKCKFSHDINVGRKVEKKDVYSDARDENGTCLHDYMARYALFLASLDTMDKWDDEKLRTVVLSKAGNPRTSTDVGHLPAPSRSACSLSILRNRLSASTSSKPSRHGDMAGSGSVRTVIVSLIAYLTV